VKREGEDVTLITYSYMTLKCLEAAELLEKEGISVEVLDLRTLKPLDQEAILESARKTGNVVIVHEACKRGGIGGDIAATIMEEAYDDLDGPVMRVCGKDTSIPYNLELEKVCVPTVEEIIETVLKVA
jgi:pyruvate dehydrogenase E1 component beta subunit